MANRYVIERPKGIALPDRSQRPKIAQKNSGGPTVWTEIMDKVLSIFPGALTVSRSAGLVKITSQFGIQQL
jgi:hypothetical protein